jgi:hypothetical protein
MSALGDLLVEVPTAVHVEYYADSVRRTALHRQLIETGGKISALGFDEGAGIEAALTSAYAELEAITRSWSGGEPVVGVSAAALATRAVEPVRWIIPGLICAGFGYLAAKPGMGKTWMLLQWAHAVATGGRIFGSIPVERPGKVLFFALEDSEASLVERLRIIFGDSPWPENLICFHMESGPNKSLPLRPIDDGGLLQLDLQLRQHPDTVMVIIDTLTAVAPIHRTSMRGTAYTDDYRGYMPLRHLADRHGIPIIGSWHYNKQGSVDPMEMLSGSMGLPAVSINRLGIVRDRDSDEGLFCSFAKRGREVRWQVRYDPITCQWVKLGDAKDHQMSVQKRAILDALDEAGRPMRLADLARAADMKYQNTIQLVKRMVAESLVLKRESDGLYCLPGRALGANSDRHNQDSDRGPITMRHGVGMPESVHSDRDMPGDHCPDEPQTVIGAMNRSLWGDMAHQDEAERSDRPPITIAITADHHDLLAALPESQRTTLRAYLRSNMASDQQRAQTLCAELGCNYHQLYVAFHGSPPMAD